ncbi:MAG TPA: hypothetical protein DCQ06_00690 [Myxococcales bacterium]|nr:hypothetical protein [Myxococcales bacterium]HAN30089.1 hypothetical protein [Myxococcales bacterium]
MLRSYSPGGDMRQQAAIWLLCFGVFGLWGCGGDEDASTSEVDALVSDGQRIGQDGSSATVDTLKPSAPPGNADFTVQGSVNQVFVTKAKPATKLEVRDSQGTVLASGETDKWGSKVFREVAKRDEVRVYVVGAAPEVRSDAIEVMDVESSQPNQSFYDSQVIEPGPGYITTRDGTKLAYFATLPGPADEGPYPTIVNYSGHSPAKPGQSVVGSDLAWLCETFPVLCDAPNDPSSMMAAVAGYATVSVNMRGTGCSGGAYDYFETLQLLDGYDVVETVAAQPWTKGHRVGMVGLSYPGITQLFVAKTNPPSLAAIAPVSVIGNTATTLVPGGILNKGFALSWINNVYKKAAPYGQGWEKAKIATGDTICEDNQLLHDQRMNNVEQAQNSKYWIPEIIDPLNPTGFADKIKVPVFMACAWQDEQTGPYFITLMNSLVNAPSRRFIVYNGVHSDGFAPQVLAEWLAFLQIHVAQEKPTSNAILELLVEQFTQSIYGVTVKLPKYRWADVPDYAAALKKWNEEPEVWMQLDNGAPNGSGAPNAGFTHKIDSWPPADREVLRWYLHADGTLSANAPTELEATTSFLLDPDAGGRGIIDTAKAKAEDRGIWSALPAFKWQEPDKGYVASFVSPALEASVVMAGTGSVDMWIRAPTSDEAGAVVDDADIEVTLSEVRPDGKETMVQHGWLRASYRQLTENATELWPEWVHTSDKVNPLTPGQWTPVRVAIAGFAHAFRAGSRVRLSIDSPGDSRADWRFDLKTFGDAKEVRYGIAHDAAHPTSVALPVVKSLSIPTDWPACPSLRGQPCRTYAPVANVALP